MTIEQAKRKLVSWLISQLGTREGPNNRNPYAEYLTKMYGWYAQNQPWCDVFADAAFVICFGYDAASAMTFQYTGRGSAKCSVSAQLYKDNGAWYKTPEVGDQVFFYVDGGINHTGIVTEVNGSNFTTVEGNSSDMVARHTYAVSSPRVAGFGRPKWSVVEKLEETEAPTIPKTPAVPDTAPAQEKPAVQYHSYTYSVRVNLLKLGDYGPQVKAMQALLNAKGYDCGDTDGIFGSKTEHALVQFQSENGLTADGEFGGQSFTALWNA